MSLTIASPPQPAAGVSPATPVPEHIAIIMDGNGRWAMQRGKPRTFGHQEGLRVLRDLVQVCVDRGVRSLTLYAFSRENWRRPDQEVTMLMSLFLRTLKNEIQQLHENGVRLRFIGDNSAFEEKMQQHIRHGEHLTRSNRVLNLSIAANYGGRWDITQAAKVLARKVAAGELSAEQIDEHTLGKHTALGDLPDPDLMIRTSGEIRLSNYLLWQLAYTELYFTDVLWPDFDQAELQRAIAWFGGCNRRYGQTGEQLAQC